MEIRERVEEVTTRLLAQHVFEFGQPIEVPLASAMPVGAPLFAKLGRDDLLSVGVPEDWNADVQAADDDGFLALTDHLPAEAAEALLQYVSSGALNRPPPAAPGASPLAHPDTLRRFRVVENVEELQAALDYPWEKWAVFLHPMQRDIVQRSFPGPARIAGSAGTGKTVVALHRAMHHLGNRPTLASCLRPSPIPWRVHCNRSSVSSPDRRRTFSTVSP